MGYGTNVQWVFCVQAEDDTENFPCVPAYWHGIVNAANLEMFERPELLNPQVQANNWESTTVTCAMTLIQQFKN